MGARLARGEEGAGGGAAASPPGPTADALSDPMPPLPPPPPPPLPPPPADNEEEEEAGGIGPSARNWDSDCASPPKPPPCCCGVGVVVGVGSGSDVAEARDAAAREEAWEESPEATGTATPAQSARHAVGRRAMLMVAGSVAPARLSGAERARRVPTTTGERGQGWLGGRPPTCWTRQEGILEAAAEAAVPGKGPEGPKRRMEASAARKGRGMGRRAARRRRGVSVSVRPRRMDG